MRVPTKADILFEKFCKEVGVRFNSIEESKTGRRTPDYELYLQMPPILVEVKQIDPNPDDKDLFHQHQETGGYEFKDVPGKRLRGKISDASSQLKEQAEPGQSTLLVVYNNVSVLRGFTAPFQMMSAMYGQLEGLFIRSCDPTPRLLSVSYRLGGSRKITPKHNTTLSAVAALFEGPEGPYLNVYHNQFASNPILAETLRFPRIFQMRIREGSPGKLPEWIQV